MDVRTVLGRGKLCKTCARSHHFLDTLPLPHGSRLALLGPHVNISTAMLGNYYGDNFHVFNSTPELAFKRRTDVVVTAVVEGCDLASNDTSRIPTAVAAAKGADIAVVFVGLTSNQVSRPHTEIRSFWTCHLTLCMHCTVLVLVQLYSPNCQRQGAQTQHSPALEREGFDRTVLTLPGQQQLLIEKVVESGTPTVVVFINSGGLAVSPYSTC